MRGLCKFESIIDGTLDLENIAVLNDAIDVEIANERSIRERQSLI